MTRAAINGSSCFTRLGYSGHESPRLLDIPRSPEASSAVDLTLRKMGIDVIGMEQYAADSSRPAARCKRDVEVADVYVLILG
jgi:hypothetical protein